MKLPIALQLYSVREEMQKDFRGTLEKVKEMGYDGVEFAGLHGRSADEVHSMLGSLGLTPISAHVPFGEMLADPDETMDAYRRIGCEYVAVPWLEESRRPGGAGFQDTIEGLKTLADAAGRHGLTLLYHNHDFEFVKLGGKYALDIIFESVPALMCEPDTCWISVAGEDAARYVEKYAGRAPVVHLKDYFLSGKKPGKMYELIGAESEDAEKSGTFEFRPLGSGMQDFKKIMQSVYKAGARWVVVEQDLPSMGKTALECARMSISYLKGLL